MINELFLTKKKKEKKRRGRIRGRSECPPFAHYHLRLRRAGGLKRKKTAPSARAERAECNELGMSPRSISEPALGSSAILFNHPMRALVPDDNQILLANPPTATAPRPCQYLVAVPEFGESYLGAMPAGAENLDSVGHAAADSPRHGRLSNHAMATVICHAGEARWS